MAFDLNDLGIDDTGDLEEQLENNNPSREYKFNQDIQEQETQEEDAEEIQETQELDDSEGDISNYMDIVTERFEVAQFYLALLKNALFGNKRNKASSIVEKEVRQFCRDRLELLMGVNKDKSPAKATAPVQLPFDKDQIDVLVQLANNLIAKSKMSAAPTVQLARVPEPVVNPVNIQPSRPNKPAATSIVKPPVANPVNRAKPGPKPGIKPKAQPPKALVQEKIVGTDENGNPVTIKKQLQQKPAGMKPFPKNLESVLLQQSAQQVAKAERGAGGGDAGGAMLFSKIISHHSGGGNTGE